MVMFTLSCKDAGVTDCNYMAIAETKDSAVKMARDHLVEAHPEKANEMMAEMLGDEMDTEMAKYIKEKDEDEI